MTLDRPAAIEEELTTDAFLGGLATLVQPRKGHRAGLDAALLQALVPANASGLAVDLGAGVGTVAFAIAARAEKLSVVAVERDPGLVACGLAALALPENAAFAARVRLVEGDAASPERLRKEIDLGVERVDHVVMNPPFEPEGRGSQSPDRQRRDAHVAAEGLIDSWSAAAAALLKPGGTLHLIHRADALPMVFGALSGRFGGLRVLPVHAAGSAAAIRILVSARRGSRAPLALMPALVLHQPDGAWTPRADAILRGRAELAM